MSDSNNNRCDVAGYSKAVGADAEVFVDKGGKPTVVSHENPLPVSPIDGFAMPPYDTIVETPPGAAQTGGKLEFFQSGPEGEKVATLMITINADRRIIQRAS